MTTHVSQGIKFLERFLNETKLKWYKQLNETKIRKEEQIMFIMFEKNGRFHKTSDNQFIKTASVIIGTGIVTGRYSDKNREIMSKAVAEFFHEYRKNPISLDVSSYSYIEAKALENLIKEGMEYPNMDVLDMFATILGIYMIRVDEEV